MKHPCADNLWSQFPERMVNWFEALENGMPENDNVPEDPSVEWQCDQWKKRKATLQKKFNDVRFLYCVSRFDL